MELRGPLAWYNGESGQVLWKKVDTGTTAGNLLSMLRVPREFVVMIAINGRKVNPNTTLEEGDVVVFFPPVAGG